MPPRVRQQVFLTNVEHLSNTQVLWGGCSGRTVEGGHGGKRAEFPIDKGAQIFVPNSKVRSSGSIFTVMRKTWANVFRLRGSYYAGFKCS